MQILEVLSNKTKLKVIRRNQLGFDEDNLHSNEYIDKLCKCISKQEDMEPLDILEMMIDDYAAINLFKFHFSKLNNLKSIPAELFKGNSFLQSEENVQQLCQLISTKSSRCQIDFGDLEEEINFPIFVKILESYLKIDGLTNLDIGLLGFQKSFLVAEGFFNLLSQQIAANQSNIEYLDFSCMRLGKGQAKKILEDMTKITSLKRIDKAMFGQEAKYFDHFDEDNVDMLCQCISLQNNLEDLEIMEMIDHFFFKVLEACTQIGSLKTF